VKMDYNYNYSDYNSNPYFTPASFNSDLPTWHYITLTLTNQVCQIGLIRINICPNPSIMNKNGIIIITLHRVSGDTTPRILPSITLPTNRFIYSIPRRTYRRKIFFRKEFWSLPWVHTTSTNHSGLNSPKQFLNPRSLL